MIQTKIYTKQFLMCKTLLNYNVIIGLQLQIVEYLTKKLSVCGMQLHIEYLTKVLSLSGLQLHIVEYLTKLLSMCGLQCQIVEHLTNVNIS